MIKLNTVLKEYSDVFQDNLFSSLLPYHRFVNAFQQMPLDEDLH